jgi:hypothetical protein
MAKKKQTGLTTELERLDHFKRLVVAAMFSDRELNQRFVLKGGNAIDLVLQVGTRASIDIDLSMATDFAPEQLENIRQRLEQSLENVFSREGYKAFDVTLEEKPPAVSPEIANFWGGYSVTFKLIEAAEYQPGADALDSMRRNAIHFGPKGKFEIDISKFEYCPGKQAAEIEGRQVFAYSPEMLVCEKLRALCQQMPEYGPVVKRTRPVPARRALATSLTSGFSSNASRLSWPTPTTLTSCAAPSEQRKFPSAFWATWRLTAVFTVPIFRR